MAKEVSEPSDFMVWKGRPWILPDVVFRTILIFLLGIALLLVSFYFNVVFPDIIGVPFLVLVLFIVVILWLVIVMPLLLLKASNRYTLRNDGLEVRTGIFSIKSFVLAPIGFSDLQIYQSVLGRIVNFGDITIRTQGERTAKMRKVRDPNEVAILIRQTMGKPIVRIQE